MLLEIWLLSPLCAKIIMICILEIRALTQAMQFGQGHTFPKWLRQNVNLDYKTLELMLANTIAHFSLQTFTWIL